MFSSDYNVLFSSGYNVLGVFCKLLWSYVFSLVCDGVACFLEAFMVLMYLFEAAVVLCVFKRLSWSCVFSLGCRRLACFHKAVAVLCAC